MVEIVGLAVFARLASRPIPRVVRMARVAAELGYTTVFCGANREPGLAPSDEWQGIRVVRFGRHFPLLNGRHPWVYLRSVLSYNRALYRFLRDNRPGLVHASDLETMPACILFRRMNAVRLVYNIHDNVAQRYNMPAAIRAVLNWLEGLCVRQADVTVVPEEFRRAALPSWCRSKVEVVRNTPGDVQYSAPMPSPDGRIRIFFGGWLDWGRGLRSLLDLAASNPRIDLRLAGEGSEDIIRELARHPGVTYLGFLDHDAVIAETRHCHLVPALYDPQRLINRYAASNKVAEALAIGRPLLLNSETGVSRLFAVQPCVIAVPYNEVSRSWARIEAMMNNWQSYLDACHSARRLFEEHYAWLPVKQAIKAALQPTTQSK